MWWGWFFLLVAHSPCVTFLLTDCTMFILILSTVLPSKIVPALRPHNCLPLALARTTAATTTATTTATITTTTALPNNHAPCTPPRAFEEAAAAAAVAVVVAVAVTLVTVTMRSKSPNIYERSVRIMATEVPTPHRSHELRARWNWYAIVDCTCWWYCNLDHLINVQTSDHFCGVALISLSNFFLFKSFSLMF